VINHIAPHFGVKRRSAGRNARHQSHHDPGTPLGRANHFPASERLKLCRYYGGRTTIDAGSSYKTLHFPVMPYCLHRPR